ncbi:MAG: YigZ family protein [Clostridia bacterium]|nr:YigZ family protein [Clostridia bacterium]
MINSFKGIEKKTESFMVVQKSKFYSFAIPVFTKSEVLEHLDNFKKEYYDATHVCYAYIINDNGVQEKYSDDGEPQGTAGFPICNVLKKKGLTNVLVVVVRYFGKIKLGAGGLTRTYSACASQVLEQATEYQYFLADKIKMEFNTNDYFRYVGIFNMTEIEKKVEIFKDYTCEVELCVKKEFTSKITKLLKAIDNNLDIKLSELYL